MVNFTILAGGFSTFIATYVFNSDASTLTLTEQTTTGPNPSWIALHPENSSILYAVNEIGPIGSLQSFLVNADGGLTLVDTVSSGGNGPTFTNPLSTGEVTAMNFGSPNCSLVATVPGDPLHFQRDSPVVNFPVNGGPSNPHMSLEFNGEVFIADFGADKIWRLKNTGTPGNFIVQGQIDVAPGNGPRHLAVHDNILFVVNELTSTLTAQQIPEAPNGTTQPLLANVSTIPQDDLGLNASFRVAELIISEPTEQFPTPLIYVSNRNLGPDFDPRGDTVAIYEFKNCTGADPVSDAPISRRAHARSWSRRQETVGSGNAYPSAFVLQSQTFTGLTQIRSMALGHVEDGGDQFLIAGANTEGGVAVFSRVDGGRNLTLVARNEDVQNRTSFVFL
ncbi:hypothetical protein JR316_0011408 [Psilocybe cubensis]|uniref:Uncharacterized protein n=2 Tax=Psilocybe cubensis TaxID=181762 RepID=A0ACB8GJI1_PSICU|nr:hypothetical protein JR316_0011408 [Psilocybe cubensis]KAH9475848.1 hypothetical protein JR316_0011408 [Psilocybe cubensis]